MEIKKICISIAADVLLRLDARAGQVGKKVGLRSLTLSDDLRAFYDMTDRAKRAVLSLLSAEEVRACRAALLGTYLEPGIAPHIVSEVEEGLEETDPRLMAKLSGFGLMERYALMEVIRHDRDS